MNKQIINILIGIGMFLCTLFSGIKEINYISLILVCIFIAYIYKGNKQFIFKYLIVFFSLTSVLIGLIFCDFSNIYLMEIDTTSHFVGSIAPFVLFYYIFINCMCFFDCLYSNKKTDGDNHILIKIGNLKDINYLVTKAYFLVFALNVFLFLLVLSKPFFLLKVGRIAYQINYLPNIAQRLQMYSLYLVPLVIISSNMKYKGEVSKMIRLLLITYFPFILYSFWTGNKFSLIWILLCLIISPCSNLLQHGEFKIKGNKKMVMVFGLLFIIILLYYFILEGGMRQGLNAFGERVAMQGQLWWVSYARHSADVNSINGVKQEINAILESITSSGEIREYGVYRLMNLFGQKNVLLSYFKSGVRFSACGIELPFYYMGFFSFIIIPLIEAPIYVFFINKYIENVKKGNIIRSYIYLRIFICLMSCFGQGDIYVLFGFDFIIYYVLLILIKIVQKKEDSKDRNLIYEK